MFHNGEKIQYLDRNHNAYNEPSGNVSIYVTYCSDILTSKDFSTPIDILTWSLIMNSYTLYYYYIDRWESLDISFNQTYVANINKYPIKYYKAILSLTDNALICWREYEKSEGIDKVSQATADLGDEYVDDSNLTSEENALMAERQKFVAEHFAFSTSDVTAQILSIKAQAENLSARIDKINRGENSIRELAELEREPRVSFEFLVENLSEIIIDGQQRVNFFKSNKDFSNAVLNYHKDWKKSYIDFKTNLRGEFEKICRKNGIEEDISGAWYEDWQDLRFKIEEKFLPLIKFALKAELPADFFKKTLELLQTYKNDIDEFYLQERKNIYQKFAFQVGGDLQEKFETESKMYKLTENLQRGLQEIIFANENAEVRIFFLKWAESLINLPIDAIVDFVKFEQLDEISAEVLNQFIALKRRNFDEYLKDSQTYSDALQKRENEYNSLMFRMRKDLNRK